MNLYENLSLSLDQLGCIQADDLKEFAKESVDISEVCTS